MTFTCRTAFQHLEIISDNFSYVNTLTLLIFIVTCLNSTSYPNQCTFLSPVSQIFSLLAPDNTVNKVSFTFTISTFKVTINRKAECCNSNITWCITKFRITGHATNEYDIINHNLPSYASSLTIM